MWSSGDWLLHQQIDHFGKIGRNFRGEFGDRLHGFVRTVPAQPSDVGIDRSFSSARKQRVEVFAGQQFERRKAKAVQVHGGTEFTKIGLNQFGGQILFTTFGHGQFTVKTRRFKVAQLYDSVFVDQDV